jgi:ribosomal protein L5
MNNIINKHIVEIVLPELLLKYNIVNLNILPDIQKVILSIQLSQANKASVSVLISLFTFLKPVVTLSKKNQILLNLKKGEPVGVKVTLRKKHIENFILYFILEILPSTQNLQKFKTNETSFNYQIKDIFEFKDFSDIYLYLSELITLDISIVGKNLNKTFYSGLRIPIKK